MKIAFVTFGCRLNRAESLDLEARYRTAGHEIIDLGSVPQPSVPQPSQSSGPVPKTTGTVPKTTGTVPDLILVRGCSVTAKAQRDCEKAIAHLRTQFPTAEVRPIGCLPNAGPVPTIGPVPPKNMGKNRAFLHQNCENLPFIQIFAPAQKTSSAVTRRRALLPSGNRKLFWALCRHCDGAV